MARSTLPATTGEVASQRKHRKTAPPHQDPRESMGRALFAEALGTGLLTFSSAGSAMVAQGQQHTLGFAATLVAPGILVMVMIYALGEVSGAHLNPAVTLAFAIRHDCAWRKVPGYWAMQFGGAIVAAALLRVLLGTRAHLGATLPDPHQSMMVALVFEILMTSLLVIVIVGTAQQSRLVGPNAAIAVGATIVLCGLIAGPITGASMNPARSFGPDLVSLDLRTYWIYLLGPMLGSALGVACAWGLHGAPKQSERRAAEGNQK
jgi:aquaporin Z